MIGFLLAAALVAAAYGSAQLTITNHWDGGFQGTFTVHADHAIHGWRAHLIFDRHIDKLEIWKASVVETKDGGKEWVVSNMAWDADLSQGQDLEVNFVCRAPGNTPGSGTYYIEGLGSSTSGPSSTPIPAATSGHGLPVTPGHVSSTATSGHVLPVTPGHVSSGGSHMKYNYSEALGLSILFYDAQRSGRLPANNPIPWRGDSAVNDGDAGHDLSGGWYDAGDHVKFNLPMAYSTWVLEWGFLKFKDAYQAAGQTQMMCDSIKWPLDYFLKCWIPAQNVLYVQVGNGGQDHSYWGRPENMHMARPAYKVTASRPGSDVAGDTAAALAAGYLVFKNICADTSYADRLLTAAKSLYTFAKTHKGIYSQSVNEAAAFYGSTGYQDELSVAAAWMHRATGGAGYLQDARAFHQPGTPWALSWDDTKVAGALLLYEITHDASYRNDVTGFVSSYMPGGSVTQTRCGLAYRDQWGANRYAANAAFVATMAAADGINPDQYKKWAMSQINYILGDNKYHMSYEIGFGSHYPRQPHHRGRYETIGYSKRTKQLYHRQYNFGSACPTTTASCNIGNPGPNPNLLKGAVVGGPDGGDNYADRRDDYVKNEVACDYNAGFQSALAGLLHFSVNNDLPAAPAAKC